MKVEHLDLASEECKDKEFYAIDLFKFLFSIAIISLHYQPEFIICNPVINMINQYFSRLAVPFFFIASGYFLFKKMKYEQEEKGKAKILKKYLKNILKMYIVWSIINWPLIINQYEDREIGYIIKRFIVMGTYRQFWFLWALLIAVPLVYWLNKKIKPETTLLIGIILFLIGTIGFEFYSLLGNIPVLNVFYEFIFNVFITTRNALFFGFCFVAVGNWLANCTIYITNKKVFLVFVVTSITIIVEHVLFTGYSLNYMRDMRISLLPLSVCVFYLIAQINLKKHAIYPIFRKMSMYIYCSHCILAESIGLIFKVNLTFQQQYICGVVFSIVFAYILTKINFKRKNQLIREKI